MTEVIINERLPSVFTLEMDYPELWARSNYDHRDFIAILQASDLITPIEAIQLFGELETYWEDTRRLTATLPEFKEKIGTAIWEKIHDYLIPAFEAVLHGSLKWADVILMDLGEKIVRPIKALAGPIVKEANKSIEYYGKEMYNYLLNMMAKSGPITPERAPALAMKLYMFAFSMGMGAHVIASTCEIIQPLKHFGLHHTAAMLGDFASFGRIASATIGVMTSLSIARPMTYAINAMMLNKIPDEKLLIEFRAKREIDFQEFAKAMRYQGFDDYWTKIIERWQWKDPRMLEIVRMADVGLDQGAPPAEELPWLARFGVTGKKLKDWWLYRKYMRAGYEDCDIPVMVRFIHRRMSSFAMTYVRTAIRRNYRWGFLGDEELSEWMDRLNLPEESKTWIRWAGELDREYFHRQDRVRLYTTQFRNDIITSDDFYISLLAMGIPERDADLTVSIEESRKVPKITQSVERSAQKAMADVQKKYVQLYLQQYRKDLIDAAQLYRSLVAVGLQPELAEVTASLEQTKKFKP